MDWVFLVADDVVVDDELLGVAGPVQADKISPVVNKVVKMKNDFFIARV